MKMRPIILLVLAALLGGATTRAQEKKETEINTVLIQDGQIFINGRIVQMPQLQNVSGDVIEHSYFQATFLGEQPLIFPIGQHWFRFEEDELVPHNETGMVEMEGVAAPATGLRPVRRSELMYRDAVDLYYRDLQQRNRRLSVQLSAEQEMEYEARSLAARILSTRNDRQKQALLSQLRETLGQILDLKQENRAAEIAELEERLNQLKLGLEKRQAMRDQIIEARIEELVGNN